MARLAKGSVETARISFEVSKPVFEALQKQRNEIKENNYPVEYDWDRIVIREIASMNKVIAIHKGEAPAPKKKPGK
ncbi:MAG TPA: hypothetical protein P5077_00355 [bacterium]|nr:hypothetical protein [bacterium]